MNVALRKRMTLEQFLAWEAKQELRSEFDGIQPVAMTGGTAAQDTALRMPEIGVELLLAELYQGVDLASAQDAGSVAGDAAKA